LTALSSSSTTLVTISGLILQVSLCWPWMLLNNTLIARGMIPGSFVVPANRIQ
jgi:hypothetical protein